MSDAPKSIEIWHNVLWSRYKGRVFGALHRLAREAGAEVRIVQMAETAGERVALAPVDLDYHGYPYELLYVGAADGLSLWRTLPRFFWRGLTSRADFVVIAGYADAPNWAQLIGLMLRGTPRGVFSDSTLEDGRPGWWRARAKRFFFQHADLIFHYGDRARAMALHHGARPETLVRRRQAAALPESYDASAIPARRAAERSVTPRFLYVGRFAPEKNLDRLLSAFACFGADHSDARLRIVGDGPLREALERQVAALRLSPAVSFIGGRDGAALEAEYLAATALVLPSLREPWGIVVNEALSYGCPVLVSDRCGCVPELVLPGRTGVAFDPLDEAALVRGFDLLASDAAPSPQACLAAIAAFTPENAARDIWEGISAQLARAEP